jgi:DNA polymerase III subunit delta'
MGRASAVTAAAVFIRMAFQPDHAFSLISRAHAQGRLAHAFLVSGADAEDQRTLAVRVCALVNGWDGVESLDDLRRRGAIVIEPEGKLRMIKIGMMREAERALQFTSEAVYKVVVVSDADRMNVEACNSFLKTLEEPPANTLILLLTRAPEQLLDTVRSRCVRVPLYRDGQTGLTLTETEEQLIHLLAAYFSQGRPDASRAMGLLADFQSITAGLRSDIEDRHKAALKDEMSAYGKTTDGVWLKERDGYYDDLTESAYQEQRNGLLGLLFTWLGEIQRRHFGLPALDLPAWNAVTEQLAQKYSVDDLHRRLKAVDGMRRNLSTNVREVLALEVGFLHAFG